MHPTSCMLTFKIKWDHPRLKCLFVSPYVIVIVIVRKARRFTAIMCSENTVRSTIAPRLSYRGPPDRAEMGAIPYLGVPEEEDAIRLARDELSAWHDYDDQRDWFLVPVELGEVPWLSAVLSICARCRLA